MKQINIPNLIFINIYWGKFGIIVKAFPDKSSDGINIKLNKLQGVSVLISGIFLSINQSTQSISVVAKVMSPGLIDAGCIY